MAEEVFINIPVELIAVLLVIAVVFGWLVLKFLTRIWLSWRYKPENDKSTRTEGIGKAGGEADRPLERSGVESEFIQPPVSEPSRVAEDSKTSRKFPNPFRKN